MWIFLEEADNDENGHILDEATDSDVEQSDEDGWSDDASTQADYWEFSDLCGELGSFWPSARPSSNLQLLYIYIYISICLTFNLNLQQILNLQSMPNHTLLMSPVYLESSNISPFCRYFLNTSSPFFGSSCVLMT